MFRIKRLCITRYGFTKQTIDEMVTMYMPDIRVPDIKEQAEEDYLKGMEYKDLAEKYSVSLNTVKSWIKRYNWFKEKKEKGAP